MSLFGKADECFKIHTEEEYRRYRKYSLIRNCRPLREDSFEGIGLPMYVFVNCPRGGEEMGYSTFLNHHEARGSILRYCKTRNDKYPTTYRRKDLFIHGRRVCI